MSFTEEDFKYMRMALELAKNGVRETSPNPLVGCVIVKNGSVIGKGWHHKYGSDHAEVDAVKNATESIEGATVYVTLEPCSHYGKTPPCAAMLAEHKPKEVVVAMGDPNPKVNGKGIEMLRAAGISVRMPLLEAEARELNRGFLSRIERSRPWVTLKSAISLDGCVALENGQSKWITGEASRLEVQKLRAASDALITGVGTVLADDPLLTVRDVPGKSPLRVVVDRALRTPLNAKLWNGEPLMFVTSDKANEARVRQFEKQGAKVVFTDFNSDRQIANILSILGENGINYLLLEAGPRLVGSFLRAGAVDEVNLFVAPKLLGRGLSFTRELYFNSLGEVPQLDVMTVSACGEDVLIKGRVKCSQDL